MAKTGQFKAGAIWLKLNGLTKQNANLNQMIWPVAEQIAKISEAFELFPGDIIYSGTPENVGPVVRGGSALVVQRRVRTNQGMTRPTGSTPSWGWPRPPARPL